MDGFKKVYFVGIGGAGMSALAGLLSQKGVLVFGSDREKGKNTDLLEEKGVTVFEGHDADNVPEDIDLLVYSDAVPEDNVERVKARELGVTELSYFGALGEVSKEYKTIAIAGTHGKTTTTAMLAGMLSHIDPTVIVGSIMKETGTNVVLGKSAYLLVEACEYNDHFLNLSPTVLAITNIELDHTDYFKDIEQLLGSYKKLIAKLPKDGALILNTGGVYEQKLIKDAPCEVIDYKDIEVPELLVPGAFNKENAKVALATADTLDKNHALHAQKLSEFTGTWRRFEFKGKTHSGALVYDDYAHHPTAIEKTIVAAKESYPGKKIVVFFHPHLYSRTRDFMKGFAQSLSFADEAFIAPIFPAREEFDDVTTNAKLVEEIKKAGGSASVLEGKEMLQSVIEEFDADTLIFTMGAGDMYTWIPSYISTNFG
ncbi:MAG: UDP-N-acetylmuramate--L-alanine ligase [Patescibacteria group bacterium UBA2103]